MQQRCRPDQHQWLQCGGRPCTAARQVSRPQPRLTHSLPLFTLHPAPCTVHPALSTLHPALHIQPWQRLQRPLLERLCCIVLQLVRCRPADRAGGSCSSAAVHTAPRQRHQGGNIPPRTPPRALLPGWGGGRAGWSVGTDEGGNCSDVTWVEMAGRKAVIF